MDKKKILLCAAAVLAVAAIAGIALLRPGKTEAPAATAPETTLSPTVETTEAPEETTEAVGFANVSVGGRPAPFDDKTAITVPGTSNSNKKPHSSTPQTLPPDIDASLEVEIDNSFEGNLDDIVLPEENQTAPLPEQVTQPESGLPDNFDLTTLTYEAYNAMNGRQQEEVVAMFSTPEEFVMWYRAAEALYLAEHPEA